MILGLDVSTSITGYTVMDYEGKIIRCDVWDIRNKNKYKNHFDKASVIRDGLCSMKAQLPIQHIFIEQPFTFFNSGGSSAKTMASLQKFNGIVSWLCYEMFNITPRYLTASEARKLCGIKVPRGQKAKKVVMEWLLNGEPDFKVEYTHKKNPKPKYYDMADSLVIAKAANISLSS
jgi:Holliday junction resolvasome RuvABC endonuclease subunit